MESYKQTLRGLLLISAGFKVVIQIKRSSIFTKFCDSPSRISPPLALTASTTYKLEHNHNSYCMVSTLDMVTSIASSVNLPVTVLTRTYFWQWSVWNDERKTSSPPERLHPFHWHISLLLAGFSAHYPRVSTKARNKCCNHDTVQTTHRGKTYFKFLDKVINFILDDWSMIEQSLVDIPNIWQNNQINIHRVIRAQT